MSLRLEEKIYIKNLNKFEFKKFIFLNNGKLLYPKRIINSVYFDNDFKMYFDSIEGVVPRKKIRLRAYNVKNFLDSDSNKKEIKITYFNYRDKIIEDFNLDTKIFNFSINDKNYGVCKPIINVVYSRNYYEIKKTRVTLDENINYYLIKNGKISKFGKKDSECVIEIKSTNIKNYDYLKKIFPQPRSRFSKYCRGVELLNLC